MRHGVGNGGEIKFSILTQQNATGRHQQGVLDCVMFDNPALYKTRLIVCNVVCSKLHRGGIVQI